MVLSDRHRRPAIRGVRDHLGTLPVASPPPPRKKSEHVHVDTAADELAGLLLPQDAGRPRRSRLASSLAAAWPPWWHSRRWNRWTLRPTGQGEDVLVWSAAVCRGGGRGAAAEDDDDEA